MPIIRNVTGKRNKHIHCSVLINIRDMHQVDDLTIMTGLIIPKGL